MSVVKLKNNNLVKLSAQPLVPRLRMIGTVGLPPHACARTQYQIVSHTGTVLLFLYSISSLLTPMNSKLLLQYQTLHMWPSNQ